MIEMNCIIPFEKKLKFEGNIKEIVSISLEHEVTQNSDEVLGNFIISGTYKEHELSVNTEDFKFVVPFSVELEKKIDKDSFEFWIDNFTYDIDGNEMNVKIDYGLSAEEIKEEVKEEREDPIDLIVEETSEERVESEEPQEEKEEEERLDSITQEVVNDNVISNIATEDDYMTFKIHVVKEEETIESICQKNNIDKDELLKLNDISDISVNDKLILPYQNE